jgi:hypothetical protein
MDGKWAAVMAVLLVEQTVARWVDDLGERWVVEMVAR